tara:strand:- start:100 stop:1206 length:1107 start_codon:yes stop_codon:yes gene_type:complete
MISCSSEDSSENNASDSIFVITNPITNITQIKAIGGGEIMGGTSATIMSKGLVWSTSHNPTLDDNYTNEGSGNMSFNSNINDLNLTTNYYVRAYVTTSNETIYGEEVSFITLDHNIYDGEIIFTTQGQIDEFGQEGYTKITIGIIVYESEPGNITSLAPLETLLEIGNIDPIDNFSIQIADNSNLTSLNGLQNLREVKGGITLSNNPSLKSIEQLSFITDITGTLQLSKLPGIINLQPFENLTSIGRHLLIEQMTVQDFSGLQGITSIGASFVIQDNDNLLNLDGINNLNTIGSDFKIRDNTQIYNLNGLSNLQYVGNNLSVHDNTSLSDFCGITPIITNDGVQGAVNIFFNAYNPTEQDIINGNCSQ